MVKSHWQSHRHYSKFTHLLLFVHFCRSSATHIHFRLTLKRISMLNVNAIFLLSSFFSSIFSLALNATRSIHFVGAYSVCRGVRTPNRCQNFERIAKMNARISVIFMYVDVSFFACFSFVWNLSFFSLTLAYHHLSCKRNDDDEHSEKKKLWFQTRNHDLFITDWQQ